MPKFQVQIGREATVYHTATIEADSLEDLTEMRASDIVDLSDEWEKVGQDDPEEMVVVIISDEEDNKDLADWTGVDGWDTSKYQID